MILQSFECGSWSLEWLNLPAFLTISRFHSPKDDITWWESLELALHAKRVWFAISSHLFSCSSRTQTHASERWMLRCWRTVSILLFRLKAGHPPFFFAQGGVL